MIGTDKSPDRDKLQEETEKASKTADANRRWIVHRFAIALVVAMIRFYQTAISPMMGPSCRFSPSCSQYAKEAIERYGVMRGSYLAIRRILRCHPFHPGGYDPP